MSATVYGSSRVAWVNTIKNETHQLMKEFNQEGKERASEGKERASAVKLFLAEGEKDRLATNKESMAAIKSKLQHIREEEKAIIEEAHDLMQKIVEENKELAGGVKRFLAHSETERQTTYKTMMEELRKSIRGLRERTKELRRESVKLLENLAGENGTLKLEVKKFLSESEKIRERDFNKMMSEVRAAVGEIQAYEREERRLAGAGIKEASGDVVKKKEITHEAKPEKETILEGRLNVEMERKKLMFDCKKCGVRHWPFQKCPQGKSSFKKEKII